MSVDRQRLSDFQRFSRPHFEQADGAALEALCQELARFLSESFTAASDWSEAGYDLIKRLIAVGHDLASFDDDSPHFQAWCGNWLRPNVGGELILEFRAPSEVVVTWKGVQDHVTTRWSPFVNAIIGKGVED